MDNRAVWKPGFRRQNARQASPGRVEPAMPFESETPIEDGQNPIIEAERDVIEGKLELLARLRSFASRIVSDSHLADPVSSLIHVLLRAEQLHLSRQEIANACEVSLATISRWLRGREPHTVMARASISRISKLARIKAMAIAEELEAGGVLIPADFAVSDVAEEEIGVAAGMPRIRQPWCDPVGRSDLLSGVGPESRASDCDEANEAKAVSSTAKRADGR